MKVSNVILIWEGLGPAWVGEWGKFLNVGELVGEVLNGVKIDVGWFLDYIDLVFFIALKKLWLTMLKLRLKIDYLNFYDQKLVWILKFKF